MSPRTDRHRRRPPRETPPRVGRRRALTVYVAGWLAAGGLVAGAALVVLPDGDEAAVVLPPVRQTELRIAAQRAGCELHAGPGGRAGDPPVAGAAAPAAAARFYDSAPSPPSLVGALRRGVVVISYRPDLTPARREQLRALQMAVPRGTIVAPNERMRFTIAVTAWRRLLGCRRLGPSALDAMRLFHGRFVGSGPDSPP